MPTCDLAPSAQDYWDAVADNYDREVCETVIGQAHRRVVWQHLDRIFQPGKQVLELNCGTGIDAVHLGQRGVRVLACDISSGMIAVARRRVRDNHLEDRVDLRVLPTEELRLLESQSTFDGAFSDLSGLNCVADLGAVSRDLSRLLKPGAPLMVCMIGRFVPWEIFWFLAHGHPRTALRRLQNNGVEKGALKVRYHSRAQIQLSFAPEFHLRDWMGVGITVPPSYMEPWARRFRKVTEACAWADGVLDSFPLLRGMADSVLFHFERKGTS